MEFSVAGECGRDIVATAEGATVIDGAGPGVVGHEGEAMRGRMLTETWSPL